MNDFRGAFQGPQESRFVSHVADDNLNLRIERVSFGLVAVNLLNEAVENADLVTTLQTSSCNVSTNEARTAGDEDCVRHRTPPDR
jgi:hypothetical protein